MRIKAQISASSAHFCRASGIIPAMLTWAPLTSNPSPPPRSGGPVVNVHMAIHTNGWQHRRRSGDKRRKGTGCPFCTNRKVCQHNSLHTKAPHLVPQWSDTNERSPHDFTVASSQKAWWRCECGCEWEATLNHRTVLGTGCPDCAAIRKASNQTRHPTLTESKHDMMHLWDWEMNEEAGLDPCKLRCRSHTKAHWVCHKCPVGQPHKWQAAVGSMYTCMSHGTSGCPCCKGVQACKCNSLQSLFPWVAAEWDYKLNTGTPADVAASSHKRVWWWSSRRGHWKAMIDDRTRSRPPNSRLFR